MRVPGLRSGKEMVSGIAFFGRTIDKIRLHEEGKLPSDYNLGTGFDDSLCEFLRIRFSDLQSKVLEGGGDEEILEWCFERGARPSGKQIRFWNHYVLKLGWRDAFSEELAMAKETHGFAGRDDIDTWVDFHDADEGRM